MENQEKEANGIEDARASTLAYAQARGKRRRAKRVTNQAMQAQVDLVRAVQRAASFGVTELPALPPGIRASAGAMLEAMLSADGGVKSYALAKRIYDEAMDRSAPRSLDAARLVTERTEDPRVKRTETVRRSARIVLHGIAPEGGTSEIDSGPIQESQRTIDARVVDPAAPVLSSPSRPALSSSSEPTGGGDEASAARGTLLESRIDALETGQRQVLAMLEELLRNSRGT